MRQRGARPHADNRRKRAAGSAEQSNLMLQLVADLLLGLTWAKRPPDGGKGPLGDSNRLANLGDFAGILDLPERLDEARGMGQLRRLEGILELSVKTHGHNIGFDRQ